MFGNGKKLAEAPADSSGPSIVVRNLRVNYGDREILHGISFEVQAGETMVILGGSGSGKMILLDKGNIVANGTPQELRDGQQVPRETKCTTNKPRHGKEICK